MLTDLNKAQIDAVKHLDGPALVVAGPGSGKTRVLTHRVAYLIKEKNIPELSILCVTFTNKAAGEIKSRVNLLLNDPTKPQGLSWSGTFHSICSRILRKDGYNLGIQPNFVIYDTDDQRSLIKTIIKDFGIDPKKFNPAAVSETISSAKSELISPDTYGNYAAGYFQKTVAKIYPEYQKRLRANNALDFDDLLFETVKLFQTVPEVLEKYQTMFKYILVDEYQDTNKAQYVLTKALAAKARNLFVVGDMSQAIYAFRGADFRNILNFQKDYKEAKIYNLDQNYRSTQNILDAAKNVIKNNSTYIPLDLWTENGSGDKLVVYTGNSDTDEVLFVAGEIQQLLDAGVEYKDIAVLYRTNAQSRNIEEFLIRHNIPYKIYGGQRFYARKEIKDVISYLKVVQNPKDSVSWERIINVPPKGIGQKSVEKLQQGKWDLAEIQEKTHLPVKTWLAQAETLSTLELMDRVLYDTKYLEFLNDGSEEGLSRIENIKELKSVASQFIHLADFLENVALIESSSKASPEKFNAVNLMTVHASKGLEFHYVFIIGMEEGLFPHNQSLGELQELEEERRLCYVAITRAMKRVFMSNAKSRLYFGTIQQNFPSRFLSEISKEVLEFRGSKFTDLGGGMRNITDKFLDELDYDRGNFSWD